MTAPAPLQVRPGWLLGALGLLLLGAGLCAYLSLCLLFVQGQWQLLYRPTQHAGPAKTPAEAGLAFTEVRFGATLAGAHELSGWWLPATPSAPLAGTTVLYLHDAAGSLVDTVPELTRLHQLGCAVLAIDYRGYGSSAAGRPGEAAMLADARSAVAYLAGTRHIDHRSLVIWGRGVGATLAAEVGTPQLPLVLEDPAPPAIVLLGGDPRTRLLPVRWLLQDRLDAGPALRDDPLPKLFLEFSGSNSVSGATSRLYAPAAMPKQLAATGDDATIRAFLLQTSTAAAPNDASYKPDSLILYFKNPRHVIALQ